MGVFNPMDMTKMMTMMAMMKGGGKSKGKGGIRGFDGKLRVWIGGLPQKGEPDDALNKRLKEHMSSTGLNCLYAQVGKNGMGGAAFKTYEEAQQAIATMNGTIFEGAIIQVDNLTKGEKIGSKNGKEGGDSNSLDEQQWYPRFEIKGWK